MIARANSLQQQIDLTKAQLELDQDELEDIKGDLIRSGADRLSRIQRQFNRHEAAQKEYETNNPQAGERQCQQQLSSRVSLLAIAQFSAWNSLRGKAVTIAAGAGRGQANRHTA